MRQKITSLELETAAYLYSQGNSQDDIATTLEISQSVVSRLLGQARDEGLIQTTVRFAEEKLAPGRLAEIEARVSPQKLKQKLQDLARRGQVTPLAGLRVFPSASRGTRSEAWERRFEEFGTAASGHVRDLLLKGKVIGVSWGSTIASLIQGIKGLPTSPSKVKRKTTQFFPLCGEPIGASVVKLSSSSLAEDLGEMLSGGDTPSLSLAAVPALIPTEMRTASQVRTIEKLIHHVEAYKKIFGHRGRRGEQEPWVQRMDGVLTSVGSRERSLGYGNDDGLIRWGEIDRKKLNNLVIGDIGGVLIPRPNLTVPGRNEVAGITKRWTGVRLADLKRCAENAASGAVGVIVVAIGSSKAECICHLAKLGLVNQLVIDQDLADALDHWEEN